MPRPLPDLPENALDRISDRIAGSAMFNWLQLSASCDAQGLVYHLGFADAHIGNPVIRAIHGGVVSAFLESAAWLEIYALLPGARKITTTSVHTSYLRSTRPADMHARVNIHRLGRRFAFLEATCWQADADTHVAFAEIGIRVSRPEEGS